ncbi:deoxyribose-phosphate aldolase, partial [bacterium]|nr:deoxyribose-phosphate aldolase [bacterium]
MIDKIKKKIEALGLPSYECEAEIIKSADKKDIASYLEHTVLKPDATVDAVVKLCNEAKEHNFRGVCINPAYVAKAKDQLQGTECFIVTVIGFPLGMNITNTKVNEVHNGIEAGADEVDMVIPVGILKSGDYKAVFEDIRAVVEAAGNTPVKVIIEICLLTQEEKIAACLLSKKAGAAFVKTSTGFSTAGATVEDVKLMRQ